MALTNTNICTNYFLRILGSEIKNLTTTDFPFPVTLFPNKKEHHPAMNIISVSMSEISEFMVNNCKICNNIIYVGNHYLFSKTQMKN